MWHCNHTSNYLCLIVINLYDNNQCSLKQYDLSQSCQYLLEYSSKHWRNWLYLILYWIFAEMGLLRVYFIETINNNCYIFLRFILLYLHFLSVYRNVALYKSLRNMFLLITHSQKRRKRRFIILFVIMLKKYFFYYYFTVKYLSLLVKMHWRRHCWHIRRWASIIHHLK